MREKIEGIDEIEDRKWWWREAKIARQQNVVDLRESVRIEGTNVS